MGWYRFGDFELDLDAFELRRGREVLPMQPKVFDVLRHLVERHGAVVSKSELLETLWPDEHVNENAVSWSVSHIRRTLGQRGSRWPIETVHGRGYRFGGEVERGEGKALAAFDAGAQRSAEPRASSMLVGRASIMAELERRVREAAGGHGAFCLITGEAGIGKTRCAEELALRARALGLEVLYGRCPEEPAAPSLWPITNALSERSRDQPALAAQLRQLLASEEGVDLASPEACGAARFRMIEQAASILRERSAARPLLFVLDDLHWADAGTLDVLRFIAPELHELPLCVVATLRDGELQPGSAIEKPLLRLVRHAHTVPVSALGADAVAELAHNLGGHRPPPALAEALCRAAGGVPLFVHEIVRSLLREHGENALAQLAPEAIRTPALARDLLRARMQRLPEATIALLARPSVIGDSFDLSLLLALCRLEPETLLERLEPALAEGQLTSAAPHTYRFVHSLFRSVLYEDLPAAERIAIHRELGTLLLTRASFERSPAEIARHFYLSLPAGDHGVTTNLARAAGDEAQRAFAHERAIVYYGWALDAQRFAGDANPTERAELLLSLASAQRLSGRTHDALETSARALEIAEREQLGDVVVRAVRLRRPTVAMSMVPDDLARGALEQLVAQGASIPEATRASAMSQLAWLPPYSYDLSRSKALSSRALELARELPGHEPLLEAMRARLFSLSGPDDIDALLALTEQMSSPELSSANPWISGDARTARYVAYVLAGRIAEADAVLREMRAAIADQPWPEARFFCERLAVQRAFLDGRFDDADRRWKEVHARAVRAGVSYADLFYGTHSFLSRVEREGSKAVFSRAVMASALAGATPYTRAAIAWLAAEAGDHDAARAQLGALPDPSTFAHDAHYLHLLANVAGAASSLGDRARCEPLFELLLPYAAFNTPSQTGYYLGAVAHFLGLLADALGREVRAGSHFEHALELNRAMGYRPGVVRTLLAHGKLEARLGRRSAARELLERARSEAAELPMAGAVRESELALQSC